MAAYRNDIPRWNCNALSCATRIDSRALSDNSGTGGNGAINGGGFGTSPCTEIFGLITGI